MGSRPNVLVLMSDQHNPHIAGFSGNRIVRTQNLDRLAREAAVFGAAYCQTPLCTPSRISMWTGLLPYKCAGWKNNMPIFPEHLTMPEHFARHGYVTCGVGKMHVGGDRPMNGFQFRPYGDLKPNRFCGHQPDPIRTARNQEWTQHKIGHFPFAGESELPESIIQDNVVTKEALAFILEHHDKHPDQPWFVCASYSHPHHPLTAPGRYFRRYWPDGPNLEPLPEGFPNDIHPHDRWMAEDYRFAEFSDDERRRGLAAYYAGVDFVDDCIGDLLQGLEREGLLDNTIIIYTSDHGDMASEHGLWWKRTYYEGSARVPLLIRLAGDRGAQAGNRMTAEAQSAGNSPDPMPSTSDLPVELLDLFPTLCDLCGLPTPEGLDGETLVPLIMGQGIRKKDFARSEHIFRMETTFRMIRTPKWKYVEFPEFPPVLFDMASDPGETRNLAESHAHRGIVEELRRRLWEDGESWESLYARRQADIERAQREYPTDDQHCPNQYALRDGSLVDADGMIYNRWLDD